MPHSSGGGSHSGGFSGGSFSSSGGSHSSYSSPSVPPIRRASEPFGHCHTYIYYRNYIPYYVYTDRALEDKRYYTHKTVRKSLIIAIVLMLVGTLCVGLSLNRVPRKMTTTEPVEIIDNAGIINNTKDLNKALEEFKQETGIAIGFETINNETWQAHYTDLSSYAYEQYVINFDDEECWMIVYSEPENPEANFNDWYWEGMQGDDTDSILDYDSLSVFNTTFNKELLKGDTPETALINSLKDTATEAMKPETDIGILIFGAFIILAGVLTIFTVTLPVNNTIKKNGYSDDDLHEINDKSLMITCPHCKKQFFNTDFKKCPFCKQEL